MAKVNNPNDQSLTAVVYGISLEVPPGVSDAPEIETQGERHESAEIARKIYDNLHELGVRVVEDEVAPDPK